MEYIFKPESSRIHKQDSWKKSAYAFVPFQTHFGELCGFADDIVLGGKGFDMHSHQNMEITTIVISGKQTHKDNTGGAGEIDPYSIQTMSAGTGIMHSEFNASEVEPFHSFQIWVYPKVKNIPPRHEKFSFKTEDKLNKALMAISPDGRKGSAITNQDAFFSLSKLEIGKELAYSMELKGNGLYIHCVSGQIKIDNHLLSAGDAIGVYKTDLVNIKSIQLSELILVEIPMVRGINIQ